MQSRPDRSMHRRSRFTRHRSTRPLLQRCRPKCRPTCASACCAPPLLLLARGQLESHDAKDMAERAASSQHGGGFSVDAGVRIEATDRSGLERLLRYCARPPFAMDRLKQRGADLVYRSSKGHAEPMQSDKYSGELVLTPLELIERIAQLVPPIAPTGVGITACWHRTRHCERR